MKNLNLWEQFIQQGQMRWARGARGDICSYPTCVFFHADGCCTWSFVRYSDYTCSIATTVVLGGTGIMQTIPSLAVLGFLIPVFGIGVKTAIAASIFVFTFADCSKHLYRDQRCR